MAVFSIYPIKDNFISQLNPTYNYGRDEVLDISSKNYEISRGLIQFDINEINTLINDISGSYKSKLKLYLANASNLPEDYSIEVNALSDSWIMGTGRTFDNPNPQNGSNWNIPNPHFPLSYWNGGNYLNYGISQSFGYKDCKDINCDVTNIVNDWNINIIGNNGFIIKHTDINESSHLELTTQFFSTDTHTIYPPSLDFYWDDTAYSSSLSIINNEEFKTTITNLKTSFYEDDIHTFKIKNRDIYPTRMFQTGSIYLNNKILPSSSYWALKDTKSKEIVVDYDEIGTKLGADNNGNYFTLYMNGLQPERYYQILIKTIINNNIIIIDNPNNYFKIIK